MLQLRQHRIYIMILFRICLLFYKSLNIKFVVLWESEISKFCFKSRLCVKREIVWYHGECLGKNTHEVEGQLRQRRKLRFSFDSLSNTLDTLLGPQYFLILYQNLHFWIFSINLFRNECALFTLFWYPALHIFFLLHIVCMGVPKIYKYF